MFIWNVTGERLINLMTVRNLVATLALLNVLEKRFKTATEQISTILEQLTMLPVARLPGST